MNKNNYRFISIDIVANRIKKHPLLKDMNFEDIIAYTVDVLRLVSVPRSYEEKGEYLTLSEFKAKLPTNCLNVKSVDYVKGSNMIPMVIATDTLNKHISKVQSKSAARKPVNSLNYTYTLNANKIYTNQDEGQVFVVYDTLKCGEDGYPMIPDSVPLRLAIENWIKFNVFSVFEDLGKISGRAVERADQQYSWYIGKAQTEFQGFINDDDMESFLRDFKRLFIQNKTHGDRGLYNSLREQRYKN